jgi:hypothetical protein
VSRRAAAIGAAAVAVALAATLAVLLTRGGGPAEPPLRAPASTADTVPELRAPAAKDLPKGCGVGAGTVKKYAPGSDTQRSRTDCRWYSLNGGKEHCGWCVASGGDRERVLEATVTVADGQNPVAGQSVAGNALRQLGPASAAEITAGTPSRTVAGLGDEARYTYSPAVRASGGATEGASLRFRAGAVVVAVRYRGRDFSDDGPQRQVPEAEARRAVLAAASDAARALGKPARPVFAEPAPAGPPPVRRVPRPCDLVPASLAERLAPGAVRRRGASPVADQVVAAYGQASDTCVWDSTPTCCLGKATDHRPERHLSVTVRSFAEWRRGIAVRLAARDYLQLHYDARDGAGHTGFRAVRGLGDQAYADYRTDVSGDDQQGGDVAFRVRNLVIVVAYTGARDEPLPHDMAVNAAYTVAARARAALPA